ncbi:hypothetical protein LWI28_011711 [Acer negundo]|uniref:Protein kinase domain-containing protein n=1 Tax=Acer negundo TaxID=4023 RepID=A0AAD5JQ22_ACENE|nr:hypothetical protein LWI28_011711 [Acer negundo]
MVARVGDFGIAKLLGEEDSTTQTHTLATIGYMAPEYGSEGIVSVRVAEVADTNLLGEKNLSANRDCILSILQVAVDCTLELPESRLDITNVLGALQNIKTKFQKNKTTGTKVDLT